MPTRLFLVLPEGLNTKIRAAAKDRDMTVSTWARLALEAYLPTIKLLSPTQQKAADKAADLAVVEARCKKAFREQILGTYAWLKPGDIDYGNPLKPWTKAQSMLCFSHMTPAERAVREKWYNVIAREVGASDAPLRLSEQPLAGAANDTERQAILDAMKADFKAEMHGTVDAPSIPNEDDDDCTEWD